MWIFSLFGIMFTGLSLRFYLKDLFSIVIQMFSSPLSSRVLQDLAFLHIRLWGSQSNQCENLRLTRKHYFWIFEDFLGDFLTIRGFFSPHLPFRRKYAQDSFFFLFFTLVTLEIGGEMQSFLFMPCYCIWSGKTHHWLLDLWAVMPGYFKMGKVLCCLVSNTYTFYV